jgi:hypothetical protein
LSQPSAFGIDRAAAANIAIGLPGDGHSDLSELFARLLATCHEVCSMAALKRTRRINTVVKKL